MTDDDFTGPALAAGTILGVRAFDIDNLGRLRGGNLRRRVPAPGRTSRTAAPRHKAGGRMCPAG